MEEEGRIPSKPLFNIFIFLDVGRPVAVGGAMDVLKTLDDEYRKNIYKNIL
jgi:hypothetical protein